MQVNTQPYKNPPVPDYDAIIARENQQSISNQLKTFTVNPKVFNLSSATQRYQAGDYVIELTRVSSKPDKFTSVIYIALTGKPFEKIAEVSEPTKGKNKAIEEAYYEIIDHQKTAYSPGKTCSIELARACFSYLTFDEIQGVHGIGVAIDPKRPDIRLIEVLVTDEKTQKQVNQLLNPNNHTFKGWPVMVVISPLASAQNDRTKNAVKQGYKFKFSGSSSEAIQNRRNVTGVVLSLGLVATLIYVLK